MTSTYRYPRDLQQDLEHQVLSVGIECELPRNGHEAVETLGNAASHHDGLHNYHCGCPSCAYDRPSGLWAPQEDCSVSAELVSKILWEDSEIESAITAVEKALAVVRSPLPPTLRLRDCPCEYTEEYEDEDGHMSIETLYGHYIWMDCDCECSNCWNGGYYEEGGDREDDAAGCHVHVVDPLNDDQSRHLINSFMQYQSTVLEPLASSHIGYVRDYNTKVLGLYDNDPKQVRGSWLVHRRGHRAGGNLVHPIPERKPTWEFRLWNYSDETWRIRMYAYVSRAMVSASAENDKPSSRWCRVTSFKSWLAPYMPDDIPELIQRQYDAVAA